MSTDTVLNIILTVAAVFASLLGVSSLVAALVNLGKLVRVGTWELVPDGSAPSWSAALNLVAFVVIVGYLVTHPTAELKQVDATFMSVGTVVLFLTSYIAQLRYSREAHEALSSVPLLSGSVGKTHELMVSADQD